MRLKEQHCLATPVFVFSVAGDEGLRRRIQKGVSGSEKRGTMNVGARVGVGGV